MDDRVLASDSERDQAVAQLAQAQAQGRLTLDELQFRTEEALRARTRGQLDELTSDLPAVLRDGGNGPEMDPMTTGATATHYEPPREKNPTAIVEALHPNGMRAAWVVWAIVSAANFLLWLLVSISSNSTVYPWFFWVAGPWGFALLVHTIHSRGSRHEKGSIAAAGTTCHVPPTGTPVDLRRYQRF